MTFPGDLSIGEVATRAGVATSTLRFYEGAGLLPPPSRVNGRRSYDATVLDRLKVIQLAKRCSFSLDEIRQLLQGVDHTQPISPQWRPFAESKLRQLDARARELDAMRDLVRRALSCGCVDIHSCEFLDHAQS